MKVLHRPRPAPASLHCRAPPAKTPLDCLHRIEPGYNGDVLSSRTLALTAEKMPERVARKTPTKKDTPVVTAVPGSFARQMKQTISSFFSWNRVRYPLHHQRSRLILSA
jgi:hypothetical protein